MEVMCSNLGEVKLVVHTTFVYVAPKQKKYHCASVVVINR